MTGADRADPPDVARYDLAAMDPDARLVDRSALSAEDIDEIGDLMNAMGLLRDAERRLNEASQRYMRLNSTDMRALRFLIACENRKIAATPGAIAAHLEISTASTTKLLHRLESAGHLSRAPHPRDRRALTVQIAPATRDAATETVGRQHARRAVAASRLTSEERAIVTRFLRDVAAEVEPDDRLRRESEQLLGGAPARGHDDA